MNLIVTTDPSAAAAAEIIRVLDSTSNASMVVAGGTTYIGAYSALATAADPEWRPSLFFGDERDVSPDDERSNFRTVRAALGGLWEQSNVFWSRDEEVYDAMIKEYLDSHNNFDIALLGLGPDGHTASLFPGHEREWDVPDSFVVRAGAGREPLVSRITMTPAALGRARLVIAVAKGREKAEAARNIMHGQGSSPLLRLKTHKNAVLMLDTEAASLL